MNDLTSEVLRAGVTSGDATGATSGNHQEAVRHYCHTKELAFKQVVVALLVKQVVSTSASSASDSSRSKETVLRTAKNNKSFYSTKTHS